MVLSEAGVDTRTNAPRVPIPLNFARTAAQERQRLPQQAIPLRISTGITQFKGDPKIIEASLRKSYSQATKPLDEARLPSEVAKIQSILAKMSPENAKTFMDQPYVKQNLVYFLEIKPEKLDLATQIARKMTYLQQEYQIEPQFAAPVNLGIYNVLEYLRDNGMTALRADQAEAFLKRKLAALQPEGEDVGINNSDGKVGERALIRHAIGYLAQVRPDRSGAGLENALTHVIARDIKNQLVMVTEDLKGLNQSQGIEIEVLRYVTKSLRAKEREVDSKWLPRGIPMNKHARTDWNLLELLNVHEDIGERKHQAYEMSTDPSETSAVQGLVAYELMVGGFLTEKALSNVKEGYSLHVSTVFPIGIINDSSLRQYRMFARSLAGAFASDQRIAFGGFMSGGDEVSDKSKAGTLKEVGQRKPNKMPKELALIEIRNLDITPSGQYSALHAKNLGDFAFRTYWQSQLKSPPQLNALERYAAGQWPVLMQNIQQVYAKYGITPELMEYKYGTGWESHMWQEIDQAREANPQMRKDFANTIRRFESNIRVYKRNLEHATSRPLKAVDFRPSTTNKEIRRERAKQVKYLSVEPHGGGDGRIYLNGKQRAEYGVNPGDLIRLRLGNKVVQVIIDKARKRNDGSVDKAVSPYMRVSKNILQDIGAPKGLAVLPVWDKNTREMRLSSPDVDTWPTVKFPIPRTIRTESRFGLNRIALASNEMTRLKLREGDEISIKFGKAIRKVKVYSADTNTSPRVPNSTPFVGYALSSDIMMGFGLKDGIALRSRFDADKKLLSLGPHIAMLRHIDISDAGVPSVYKAKGMVKEMTRLAREYGASLCIVDPNSQSQQVLASGYVDAYIMDEEGNLEKRRMPLPDVAYDKDNWWRTKVAHKTEALIDNYVSPPELRSITGDKLGFSQLLRNHGLNQYHPETIGVSAERGVAALQLEGLLQKSPRIFLKPRHGSNSIGIIRVDKIGASQYRYKYGRMEGEKWVVVQKEANNLTQVLTDTAALREGRGDDYIAQQNIRFADYKYTENDITYHRNPEIRLVIQRGINGRVNVTGMIAMLYSPEMQGRDIYRKGTDVVTALRRTDGEKTIKQLKALGYKVHGAIEEQVGKTIGDLVVDIGIQSDGSLMILEANSVSTPKEYFKEAGDKDGEYGAASRPIEYALYLSGIN